MHKVLVPGEHFMKKYVRFKKCRVSISPPPPKHFFLAPSPFHCGLREWNFYELICHASIRLINTQHKNPNILPKEVGWLRLLCNLSCFKSMQPQVQGRKLRKKKEAPYLNYSILRKHNQLFLLFISPPPSYCCIGERLYPWSLP